MRSKSLLARIPLSGTVLLLLFCLQPGLRAQQLSVSTDITGYLAMGTVNAEASYAFGRHWTVNAGARYNPFSFRMGGEAAPVYRKQRTFWTGGRFWPWHIYSGWWMAGKVQYQEYNSAGLLEEHRREGDRYGTGLTLGYTYLLSSHLNIEFGVGFWGGYEKYSIYECPACGLTLRSGKRGFFLPDDIIVALSYVF